jgi:hypothetical protein
MKRISLFSLSTAAAVAFFMTFSAIMLPQAAQGQESDTKAPVSSSIIRVQDGAIKATKDKIQEAGSLEIKRKTPLPGDETLLVLKGSPGKVKQALGVKEGPSPSGTQTESLDVSANYRYQLTKTPDDPKYSEQWNMKKTDAAKGWDITTGSTDTTIAIVDSGVLFKQEWSNDHTYNQPDFARSQRWENSDEVNGVNDLDDDANGYIDDKYGWDFTGGYAGGSDCPNDSDTTSGGDNGPQPYSCDNEKDKSLLNKNDGNAGYVGHGTVVGSIAAAKTDNGRGVAGTDWNAKIMNLRVFNGYGIASTDQVVAAVEYATDNGADVINLSLSIYNENGSCDIIDDKLEEALKKARNDGTITAAASGNGGEDYVCYPAASQHTLAVGASTIEDEWAQFSNYGDQLDLIAPGEDVPALTAPSKNNGNSEYVGNASGTSLSTPHVTGAAALLKGMFPGATFNQIRTNLQKGVDKVPGMSGTRTKKHGFGRLNIHKANKHGTTQHPDGTLLQMGGEDKVFLMEAGTKRRVVSRQSFSSHNFAWSNIKRTTLKEKDTTGSGLNFREGTLLQPEDADPVYVINYDGSGNIEKRHITSRKAFEGLGYSYDEVLDIPQSQLPDASGDKISDASQHPDGTLVQKPGQDTVYLIDKEESKKRHVKSRQVFESRNYKWEAIKDATDADNGLDKGTVVDFKEGALVSGSSDAVYIINYDNNSNIEKRHFTSRFIFELLGYNFGDVLDVKDTQLPNQNGEAIE